LAAGLAFAGFAFAGFAFAAAFVFFAGLDGFAVFVGAAFVLRLPGILPKRGSRFRSRPQRRPTSSSKSGSPAESFFQPPTLLSKTLIVVSRGSSRCTSSACSGGKATHTPLSRSPGPLSRRMSRILSPA